MLTLFNGEAGDGGAFGVVSWLLFAFKEQPDSIDDVVIGIERRNHCSGHLFGQSNKNIQLEFENVGGGGGTLFNVTLHTPAITTVRPSVQICCNSMQIS
ncbi:hypothetical protein T4D_10131 [Trichinella pseudospiralis]|uniref:Uncharacterized protein n=1 Tax=Trichinella pseudospiralis TaxID=6337 RepID=A0A0V1FAH1_TRIPS|nr:hypothetical protein T4D_10131 [Trichinella pseudospiralis]